MLWYLPQSPRRHPLAGPTLLDSDLGSIFDCCQCQPAEDNFIADSLAQAFVPLQEPASLDTNDPHKLVRGWPPRLLVKSAKGHGWVDAIIEHSFLSRYLIPSDDQRRAKINIEIDVALAPGYAGDADVKASLVDAVKEWTRRERHGKEPGVIQTNLPPPSTSGETVDLQYAKESSKKGQKWGTMKASWQVYAPLESKPAERKPLKIAQGVAVQLSNHSSRCSEKDKHLIPDEQVKTKAL